MRTSHVTQERVMIDVNKSCHERTSHATQKRVMSHANESCHMRTSHVTCEQSDVTYAPITGRMSCIQHVQEGYAPQEQSYVTYELVIPLCRQVLSHISLPHTE